MGGTNTTGQPGPETSLPGRGRSRSAVQDAGEDDSDLAGLDGASTSEIGGGTGIWAECYRASKALAEREEPELTRQEFLNSQVALSAETSNCSALEFWLSRGGAVNGQDAQGYAALHWAACNGDGEMVRQLVEAGARPRTRTKQGRTALDMARSFGDMEDGSVDPKFAEVCEQIKTAVATEPYDRLTADDMADMEEEERVKSLSSVFQDCRDRAERQLLENNAKVNPQPYTLNPTLSTLNPQPYTLNPEP